MGGVEGERGDRRGPRAPSAGQAPAHRLGHGADSFALPHHMGGQQSFQPQQPFPFPGGEPPHGNSRPGGDHPRNVRPGDAPGAFSVGGLRQVLHFVPQFGGLFKFPFPYRFVQLLFQLFSGRAAPGQLHFLHPRPGSALVQQIDCFVCNQQEAGLLFSDNYDHLEPEEMCRVLAGNVHSANIPCMVVTMGGKGAVFARANGECGIVPAKKVDVIDTTGAGDAFFAGTVIGLTYGKTLAESCEIGSRLAASVICITENVCPRFRPLEFGLDIPVVD